MRVVAITQARMGSTRLPGKVLKPIGEKTMLARVINRAKQACLVNEVVVATTVEPADQAIVAECKHLGVSYFCGSEEDVLDRFYQAAQAHRAEGVVRITADCPFIEPTVIDKVVSVFLAKQPDYASNVLERTYPRGLDVEVMKFETLSLAWQEAVEIYQRVHVTPYIYQNPDKFSLLAITAETNHSDYRWTVDTPEDLEFAQSIYARLDNNETFNWQDVLSLLAQEPDLIDLNRRICQKSLQDA